MAGCQQCWEQAGRRVAALGGYQADAYLAVIAENEHLVHATVDHAGYAWCDQCVATADRFPMDRRGRAGEMLAQGSRCDGCGAAFHMTDGRGL